MLDPKACAVDLIDRLQISDIPVPVEAIADHLGAKIMRRSDFGDDLCGMIFKEDKMVVIAVNDGHPPTRQRFTIAHEIGHHVMHSEIIDRVHVDKTFNYSLKRDGRSKIGQDRMEIQANRFAAELLMPTKFLKNEFKSGYIDFENGLVQLAEKYGVSVQAMSIKILDIFPAGHII